MVDVRDAVEGDAQQLAEVKRRSWQAAYRGLLPDDYLDELPLHPPPDAWRDAVRAGHPPLVAEVDGRVVGVAAVGTPPDKDLEDLPDGTGQLFLIYADEDVWGTGVGHALHEAAVARLRAAGHDLAVLWVLAGNGRAARFYERHGWQADGATRIEDLGGPREEIVRYRRDLSGDGDPRGG